MRKRGRKNSEKMMSSKIMKRMHGKSRIIVVLRKTPYENMGENDVLTKFLEGEKLMVQIIE